MVQKYIQMHPSVKMWMVQLTDSLSSVFRIWVAEELRTALPELFKGFAVTDFRIGREFWKDTSLKFVLSLKHPHCFRLPAVDSEKIQAIELVFSLIHPLFLWPATANVCSRQWLITQSVIPFFLQRRLQKCLPVLVSVSRI